jgi:hypothetical protein
MDARLWHRKKDYSAIARETPYRNADSPSFPQRLHRLQER